MFFASRRRHTRLQGDWSSDVCSSDLVHYWLSAIGYRARESNRRGAMDAEKCRDSSSLRLSRLGGFNKMEEGRVGEEGRFPGWADHLKKKKDDHDVCHLRANVSSCDGV